MNRLEGFGWISSVRGVGAATLSDVQYDKAYDNGRTHKNIPVKHLAPIVFCADFHQQRAERVVEVVEEEDFEREEESLSVDDALVKILLRSVKEPKGFHRRNLAINPVFLSEKEGKRPPRINHLEKIQPCAENCVLNALMKNNPSLGTCRHAREGKRNKGKFVNRRKVDPLTQTHLLSHCWGVGANCYTRCKNEFERCAVELGMYLQFDKIGADDSNID